MPSTFKTLLTLTSALAITGIACAQDKIPESNTELKSYGSAAETSVRGTAASDMFSESDIDKDGLLDRDEFVAYAAAQSQAGDKLFGGLLLSGDFDNQFNAYDYNADGFLTAEEMKAPQLDQTLEGEGSESQILETKPLDELALEGEN